MTNHVLLEKKGPKATITINRPEAMNALTPQMLLDLIKAANDAANDDNIKVVVLTGAGKAFCAGVDLKALNKVTPVDGMISNEIDEPGRALTETLASMPKPVIAQINGHCMTGGLEIALSCDLLYAADSAKLADTHAKWGIRPSWGMSQRLPRRVGVLNAKDLSFTARFVGGQEAAAMGLVNASMPLESLSEQVDAVCEQIASNSGEALAAYKDLYRHTEGKELAEGLAYEWNTSYSISDTAERLADFIK